jgi:hypothetical protein
MLLEEDIMSQHQKELFLEESKLYYNYLYEFILLGN